MKGKGPKHERETIINFNEEDGEASIWTASEPVYRRLLKRLGRAYLTEDGERHAVFTFPMNFLDPPRAKVKKTLTPEQRALLASRMADRRKLLGDGTKKKGFRNDSLDPKPPSTAIYRSVESQSSGTT